MWSADESTFILFLSCLSTAMVSKYVSLTHAPALVCVCIVWGKETKPVCLELLFFPVCTFSLLLSSCCFLLPSFNPNPALWLRVVNSTQGHSQLFSVSAHKSGRKDSDVWMEVAACLDLSTAGDWKCTALPTAQKLYDFNRYNWLNEGSVAPVVFCKKLLWSVAQENHTLT